MNNTINKKKKMPVLFLILAAAFLLRVIAGGMLFSGYLPFLGGCYEKGFWECGYVEYAEIAINLTEGKGFYRVDEIEGERRSIRPPLYPLLLAALYKIFNKSSIPPIFIQSIIGALTVLFAYLIAREIFNEKVGILAAVLAAIYPYYVFHDTSLQENTLFTLLTAVTIFFLIKTSKSLYLSNSFFAGIFLSLAVMTRVTLLMLLPFAILWFIMVIRERKTMMVLAMLLGFIIIAAPWLVRNTVIHGKPLFVVHSGVALWVGQNPYTLTGYPYEHLDRMTEKAWAAISNKERDELWKLSELERDNRFRQKAIQFMKENPLIVLKGAFKKVYAGLSWNFSPDEGSWIKNASYTITYLPILLLGVIGGFLARDKWKELSIIYSLFFTFIVVSAVFFAHTSHRIYLDIYLMIFSSYAVMRIKDFISQKHARTSY